MKFICDDNLGKLAKLLRTLGYDTLFEKDLDDYKLIRQSLEQNRVILTRDTKLARFKIAQNQLLITSDNPLEQLKQVIEYFELKPKKEGFFSRCLLCNNILEEVEKDKAKDKIPPYVFKTQKDFVICNKCDKVFWKGTHIDKIRAKLRRVGL
ncbi:MAG TPA: Mut7-C RNAse domain-containing protein [candidate division Zixibacteria bacterium]